MGPNPNGPRSVSYDRAIRYSVFFFSGSVKFVGPTVGDFLGPATMGQGLRLESS